MADVVTFASTGVVYSNGGITLGVTRIGVRQCTLPRIEHNVIVNQSGVLDNRFDDITYYADSGV